MTTKATASTTSTNKETSEGNKCPVCSASYRPGELVCPQCGTSFNVAGKTRRIERSELLESDKSWSLSSEISINKLIVLEIDGQQLILPSTRTVIIGRSLPGATPPDVDLTPFNAPYYGISRQHIRISREALIYVTDLASTNGTFLNGQRLFPNSDCPLSDGDELVLGTMHIKVRFQQPADDSPIR